MFIVAVVAATAAAASAAIVVVADYFHFIRWFFVWFDCVLGLKK